MVLQAPSTAPQAAARSRRPCKLRLWRRRAIGAAGPTPQHGPAAGPLAWSTGRSLPDHCTKPFRNVESKVMAGERRTNEVLVCDKQPEGNYSSSNFEFVPQKPLPCMRTSLNCAPRCPPSDPPQNSRFCSLAAYFDRRSPPSPAYSSARPSTRTICLVFGRPSLRTRRPARDLGLHPAPRRPFSRCSSTLCARAQSALQPVSTLGQRQRPPSAWDRRLPSSPAILGLVRARSGRSRRHRRVAP